MSVGAVGGAMGLGGASAMSGSASLGGTGATGLSGQIHTGSAPPPATVAEFLSTPMQQAGLEQLAGVLDDLSFSKILFALIMLAAMEGDDKKSGGGSAAMGFLAGLAMAAQCGQGQSLQMPSPVPEAGAEGGVGTNLNLSA